MSEEALERERICQIIGGKLEEYLDFDYETVEDVKRDLTYLKKNLKDLIRVSPNTP